VSAQQQGEYALNRIKVRAILVDIQRHQYARHAKLMLSCEQSPAKVMSMLFRSRIAKLVFVLSSALLVQGSAHAQKWLSFSSAEDTLFLSLREAARRDDSTKALELAERLGNYSIPSYVDYYQLKPRIATAAPSEIRSYLAKYDGHAIADRLRNDWLLELGKMRDWTTFDEQYPLFALDDDLQVKCYALASKASKGQNVAEAARMILVAPKDFGEGCPALITALVQNEQFTVEDVWAQIRLAVEHNNPALARRLAALVDVPEANIVQAIEKPALVVARGAEGGQANAELFLIAAGRLARSNLEQAAAALNNAAQRLTPQQQAVGWAQLALQASYKLPPQLADYWRKTDKAPLSLDAHQWKVRSALRAGDWEMVQAGIEAMPPSLRSDTTWIYWLGRSLKARGKPEEAHKLFESIKDQANFYGQLATEELGQRIAIPPRATPPTQEEVARASENAGFKRAFKFLELGLRFEATREWNWQLRKMNERQLLAAAEFARQNNLLDRMVNTSDRTKAEVDFTQRFPAPHSDIMHVNTESLGLDKAWVYGLIRQESRFVQVARSHVGASGLMQIMPATAQYVARKIGMNNYSQNLLNDLRTNIMLGTNYLHMVLNALDGSQALATAAYNAGPSRPKSWRSTLNRSVEGAIFAETIPFTETRGYVKSVLSNATYYAALFENRPQSLKARLGMVSPKSPEVTELGDLP
jgi:soluble lytic murein transglycosylase